MFKINTNVDAINAMRHMVKIDQDMNQHIRRLMSGLRINTAADDAAGLSSSYIVAQVAGQKVSNENISRAISLLQTADSGLDQIGGMLIRLKELATQAADDTLNVANRSAVSAEASALVTEIERIAESTNYNGLNLINSGRGTTNFTFYVGDGTNIVLSSTNTVGIAMRGVDVAASGIGCVGGAALNLTVADFMTRASAEALVIVAENAATDVAHIRTEIGAFQNRLERTQTNLSVAIENARNALSTVVDADFAMEASAMTRAQILLQGSTAMVAQVNILPSSALLLLP